MRATHRFIREGLRGFGFEWDQKTIVLMHRGAGVARSFCSALRAQTQSGLTARELRHAYQPRPFLGARKGGLRCAREMTDELGTRAFVRVRCSILQEPKPRHPEVSAVLNKVSAKHVISWSATRKAHQSSSLSWTISPTIPPSRMARTGWDTVLWKARATASSHTRNIDRDELYPVLRRLRRGNAGKKISSGKKINSKPRQRLYSAAVFMLF